MVCEREQRFDMSDFDPLFIKEASGEELEKFKNLVRSMRSRFIRNPETYVQNSISNNNKLLEELVNTKSISDIIYRLREEAYQSFLVDEAKFNFEVIREIGRSYETPARILDAILNDVRARLDSEEIGAVLRDSCSKYASMITQFFYILNLSNTQARRSRAGMTFEQVIYKMYETLGYEYVSQEKVGSRAFDAKGLGKIVDSLLPNLESFGKHRSECIIGTMKTTLRERWQEVIEELSRANLPKLYLLTMDDDISASKSDSMAEHNVIIVVPKNVKDSPHLRARHNIISFEDYFFYTIPKVIEYWKKNSNV
jgi:hypothetical protein